MPGDLSIGGGVYVYIPSVLTFWPVSGVTEPTHFWPFIDTGDYTDQGSVGGFTLTPHGTGNSFNATGLVTDGSGGAEYPTDADIADLGSNFSILFDISLTGGSEPIEAIFDDSGSTGYQVWFYLSTARITFVVSPGHYINWIGGTFGTGHHIVVITYDGTDFRIYDNSGTPGYTETHTGPTAGTFANWHCCLDGIGSWHRVAILKGTTWSDANVGNIVTAFT